MDGVVIVAAKRTPVGGFLGGLSSLKASDLGGIAIKGVLDKSGIEGGEVDEVLMGQVLSAGQGQNPARQSAHYAGVPFEKTALQINQLCGSGLRTVAMASQSLLLGDADILVAGGQESMSKVPHVLQVRTPTKMGGASLVDSMLSDGLSDAFHGYHMGVTAENIAKSWGITREEQDEFACNSQNKAERAMEEGKFVDEIVSVTIKGRKGDVVVSEDEHPRKGVTLESLAGMRAAFDKEGSVTAGNASGINDGAAALILMREKEASKRGLEPLARVVSWASAGVDPSVMGTGPIPASRKVLEKSGWKVDDLDLIESNEAFAVQSLSVMKGLDFDPSKVNVNGGAIALGHPIGASGARILTTLLYEMTRRDVQKGLATMCIGGGMGIALTVER
jgi:acetyl-CoA C-acetyltransferase